MSVYFDHNATTPLDERVLEAMLPYLRKTPGNASSVHGFGRLVRGAIESEREQVAQCVNAHPSQVIFTSGGSEANNLALKGVAARSKIGSVLISRIEHDSILQPADTLTKNGWRVHELPVDAKGRVLPETVQQHMQADTRLISIMMANNESGVLQDVPALTAMARAKKIIFHTDAVQALGKIPVDFAASGAQMMTLSSHKINGPQGAGALIVDRSVDLAPLIEGGGQESRLRSGTENVAAIVGFGKAAQLVHEELSSRRTTMLLLRDHFERGLSRMPHVSLLAHDVARLPNTTLLAVAGIDGEMLLMNLDRAGFAVSSGSACGSGTGLPSHVLQAMQVPDALAECVIRVSFGFANQLTEVDAFLNTLQQQITVINEVSQ